MNRQTWIVGAAFSALVAGAPWVASAQGGTPSAAPSAAGTARPGARPAGPPREDEGPFTPKGRTGKLREQAEEVEFEEVREKEIRKNGAAGLDVVLGFGKTGVFADPTTVFVTSFIANARYFVTPDLRFSLFVPFSTGHIEESGASPSTSSYTCIASCEPGGYNVSAFGNIAMNGAYFLSRNQTTDFGIDLTVAAPTTSGDRFGDPGDKRAYVLNKNVIASRGFENRELFESKRFGIVPGASFGYHRRWLRAEAFTNLPILIQTGGQEAPVLPDNSTQVSYTVNSVALQWLIGVQGYASVISQRLDLGLRAYAQVLFVEPIEPNFSDSAGKPSKVQFVLEPGAVGKFGNVRAGLGFIWPLGGQLGGQVQIYGLRLTAAYLFQ